MPVPASVTTRAVEGTYVDSEGTPRVGTITFRVDQPLIATVESWGIIPTPVIATLDANGYFTKTLMTSTDLDLFPSGFRYSVQERFNDGYVRTYSIDLPAGASPLELPTASQYDPGDVGLAIVHSINGRTGIVQLAAADVQAIPASQKAVANGVASLDSSGKIPVAQMPAPTAGVGSVDGRSGTVTLSDLYAGIGHVHTFPVTSVNGLTGAVSITPASISAVPTSEKAAANGVATLDAGGKLLSAQVPEAALITVFDAASQAAMLALVASRNDICRRSDLNQNFVLTANDPTVLGNWKALLNAPDAVQSVNAQTGAVVLAAADVGALASSARGAANGVASLDAGTTVPTAQIPALPASKITSGLLDFLLIPTGSTSTTVAVGNHNHDTVYVPVTSMGSPNGVATLDSTGRIPVGQMPASFTTVTSVNGYTGLVVLTAADVSALAVSARGAASGVASLDASGVIPTAQIPALDASKITSGTVAFARMPTGSTSTTVATGDHSHAYVPLSEKGAMLGVATLGSDGLLPMAQIPVGATSSSVALGSHNHDTAYVLVGEKAAINGVATLDGAGKIPMAQLPPSLGVISVNGYTGAVTLTSADVAAIPLTQKAAVNGVASLDNTGRLPFTQARACKATNFAWVTSGDTASLPNTASAWVQVNPAKYNFTIAADTGDLVALSLDMVYDPQGTSQFLDVAILVGSTPVWYFSSGTSTPAAQGDPVFNPDVNAHATAGFSRKIIIQGGHLSGGTVTFALMTYGPGSTGHIYSSTAVPFIAEVLNYGPAV